MEYWHKNFGCPFYEGNGKRRIMCQVGTLTFPDKLSIVNFMDWCCDGEYVKCSLYMVLEQAELRRQEIARYEKNTHKP